ncbi:MAG: cardiolipin synthase [Verrucomicrobiota bacterium]
MSWSLLYLASEWCIRFIMLAYVPQRRSTAASRTWLLLIFLLPWPGLLLYAVFGRIYLPKRRIAIQKLASRRIREVQEQITRSGAPAVNLPLRLASIVRFAQQLGDFNVTGGNSVELLPEYEKSIDRLVADIDAAEHHVHLLFYIFEADATGRKVAESLLRAAARGVKCRVLMDAVGSKRGLKLMAPELRAGGIEVFAMMPVGLLRRSAARFDLRNHRKIAVIDGRTGYTGSQNIVNPGFVKDHPNEELMVRLTGPVVAQLQAVFLVDHYLETGRTLEEPELLPEWTTSGNTLAHLVPSGPGYQRQNGQELIVALLYEARERVVITTPYFIPDDPFLQAIRSATARGVSVHLVVSKHANQPFSQLAQRAYYEDLLLSGVEIHLYRPHFLHAKHISIDDEMAFIGSTNMDIRSFALNAEINVLVYDNEVVRELRKVQERYFANSDQLTAAEWERRPLRTRIAQNTARLADSLL